jgi:hypothetical protein
MEAQVVESVQSTEHEIQETAQSRALLELTSLEMALVGGGNALVALF